MPLAVSDKLAYAHVDVDEKTAAKSGKDKEILDFMCKNFFDIRTFGAVMTTFVKANLNCGQVRGPVQISFSRSIDPIVPQEITITRCTLSNEKQAEDRNNTMGKKYVVPYALYKAEGYVSANLAKKVTGFSEDDLSLLWQAIINMFEHDHSAARGKMSVRELIIFKHNDELGNAPSYKLFDTIHISRKDLTKPSRSYADYQIEVDEAAIPSGVICTRMI